MKTLHTFSSYLESIETTLEGLFPLGNAQTLNICARYAVLEGGKKIRPLLSLLITKACGGDVEQALIPSCSLELIHAYSLIHDDLPCMDNDDWRRGKPTLHKAFGEAMAILTGDYLLTYAFEVIASSSLSDRQKMQLCLILAQKSGAQGMLGGQVRDIQATGSLLDLEQLQTLHKMKTGALIAASCQFGGVIAHASSQTLSLLEEIGIGLGLIFQIIDDILDVVGDSQSLGKSIGSDALQEKTTYISLLGEVQARSMALKSYEITKNLILRLPGDVEPLLQLLDFILERSY